MARYFKARLLVCALIILTLLTGLVLSSSYTKAGDDKGPGDAVSCTLAYTEGDSHVVSMANGSYLADIGNSTMQTICDDTSGYSIYAIGYSNDEYGNNNMIATINGVLNPTYNIASSSADSGATSAWAMKASAITGLYAPTIDNEFGEYRTVPEEYTRLAYFNNATDDTTGSSISLTYAIYVSSMQPAGFYDSKVKYTLVHPHTDEPCGSGQICYEPNADNVIGKMSKQIVSDTTTTLWATNFSRDGYGFAGWNTKEDGTGTSYGPNETIALSDVLSEGLRLYAMWVAPAKDNLGNNLTFQTIDLLTTTLQDGTTLIDKPNGYVTALVDERDNDVYAIAKLADGNYWMIENMRLDYDADFTESLSQGFGKSTTYGNFIGLAEPESKNFSNSRTSNSLYVAEDVGGSSKINIGGSSEPAYRMPRYNNNNTSNRASVMNDAHGNIYSYGNYYTWAAAMANTAYYNGPTEQDENGKTSETAGTSICPAGWKIPQGRNTGNGDVSGGFAYLDKQLGGDGLWHEYTSPSWRAYPNNFILSGYFLDKSSVFGGRGGSYWSSTAAADREAYDFSTDLVSINPAVNFRSKIYGLTIRCLMFTVHWYDVEVNFDDRVSSVTIDSELYGNYKVETSGQSIRLAEGIDYNISATYVTDIDKFSSWSTTENGTLGSSTSEETTYEVTGDATLSLTSKIVCPAGEICYRDNGTSNVAAMNTESVEDGATSAVLWASNYRRDGYGFVGWSTEADGSGTIYGPNETIDFDPTGESGLILYAQWVASAGSLQDWSCPSKSVMPIGTVTALTDERDGNTYAIAKLADGKCWMIENMRLEHENTIGDENKALSHGYANGFTGLAEPETANFSDSTTTNSLYTTDTTATDLNVITGNNLGSRFPRYRNDNTMRSIASMNAANRRVYSYGNYYTFAAATADTGDHTTNGESVATSICPASWRLPTGGTKDSNNDYWALVVDELNHGITPTDSGNSIYDGELDGVEVSIAVRKYPNNFVNAGFVEDGTAVHQRGARGDYWASTINDDDEAFRFSFRESGVNPGVSPIYKYDGLSVRCVSEYTGIEGYDYMQDFAGLTFDGMNALKASMEENKQYTIKDNRDNKTYYISKLSDGNIWMTQNLDYDIVDGGANIDSTNTDVPADWTDAGNLTNTYVTDDTTWEDYENQPESYDPGNLCWNGIITTDYDGTFVNNATTCTDQNIHYHLGNYYNWTASVAMADSGSYGGNKTDADQSICPAGWTLPKSGNNTDSGSFAYLINQAGLTSGLSGNIHQSPNYFVYGGYWEGGSYSVGSVGSYSSMIADNDDTTRDLVFNSRDVLEPNFLDERDDGNSVRCVARMPEDPRASINKLNYMQDFAGLTEQEKEEVLDSMVEGEQYVLKDSRDNKKYYISKLADGNVWMTQNLDLDIVNGGADINSSNTNVPDDWSDAGNLTDTYASDDMGWNRYLTAPESFDVGDLCWQGAISASDHNDVAPCADSLQNQADHSHVGNYYNWTAAVAMSDSSSYVDEGVDVKQSICPAGWTLPKGGTELRANSFANLVNQQNLTSGESGNAHRTPTYLAYSGAWEGGNVNLLGAGVVGMYHSSTVQSDLTAFRLSLGPYNTGAAAIDGFYRGTAYSIRCMVGSLENPKSFDDLDYMQDFADLTTSERAEVFDSMTLEQQYQLTDSRDGKVYYIAKLADGNVWMTQNLDLDLDANTTYTSEDTDIPDDWTPMRTTHAANDNTWVEDNYTPESRDVGNLCWTGVFNPELEVDPDDLVVDCANGDMHYHIGNYYNWTAAVAMNDSSSHTTEYDDVNQSICPAGWMLPKNSYAYMEDGIYGLGEAYSLSSGESGNAHLAPVYFTYSGSRSGFPGSVGVSGDYWSSVVDNLNASYDSFSSANGDDLFLPFDTLMRYHGSSIRCLVRD